MHLIVGVKNLIQTRGFWIFDVDNSHSIFTGSYVGVRPGYVNVLGIVQRHSPLLCHFGMREVRHVQSFQAVAIHYKRITELHGDATRIVQVGSANGGCNARRERIIEIDDDKRFIGEDVSIRSGNGDAAGASQNAAGIKRKRPLEEIVGGIAVEESANAGTSGFQIGITDHDQPFLSIRDIEKTIEKMDSLLFVFGELLAQWIDAKSG